LAKYPIGKKVFNSGVQLKDGNTHHIVAFSFKHPGKEIAVFVLKTTIEKLIDFRDLAR